MRREAARVSKVSSLNSGGSPRAWSIRPMVSGGSLGRSAANAQTHAKINPSPRAFTSTSSRHQNSADAQGGARRSLMPLGLNYCVRVRVYSGSMLEVTGLHKRYGDLVAVEEVSFTADRKSTR